MLKKIIIERKKLGLTWDLLAEGLPIAGNSLRTAFKREKVDQVYLNHVNAVIEEFKNKQGISEKEIITKEEDIIVLEELASEVIQNHHKLLQLEVYGLWFEVESQKRVIQILKE
tara:strand:+ start:5850 stop:6191 length:342 start_codon:yes stop_codon:yes gene_type:complete